MFAEPHHSISMQAAMSLPEKWPLMPQQEYSGRAVTSSAALPQKAR